jgi:hypothetical protein
LAGSIICLRQLSVGKQRRRPIAPGDAAEFGGRTGTQTGCDRFVEMRAALHELRIHVRHRRRTAIRIGAIDVILLIAATALLFTQGALLYL